MSFVWIGLIICILNVQQTVRAQDGRGADAKSTDVHVGCFAGDSMVRLSNGQEKQIGLLRTGERIISVENSNLTSDEMFLMMDKEPFQQGISRLGLRKKLSFFFSLSEILYIQY